MNNLLKYLIDNLKTKEEYDKEFEEITKKLKPLVSKPKGELTLEECDFIAESTTRLSEINLIIYLMKASDKIDEKQK